MAREPKPENTAHRNSRKNRRKRKTRNGRGVPRLAGGAIVLVLLFLTYLLFPLRNREDRIEIDRKMLARKEHFLEEERRRRRSEGTETKGRPNIVLIVADDLGKTDISLYGLPYSNEDGKGRGAAAVETPHIDAIGEGGVVFENAYCSSPICSPSRAGLLTGRYQQRFGYELQSQSRYPKNRLEYFVARNFVDMGNWVINGNTEFPSKGDHLKQGIPQSEITLGELLKASGYETAIIGKWHLGYSGPYLPQNRGFDLHYGFYEAFSLYAPVDDPDIINYRHSYYKNKYTWKKGRKATCAIRWNGEEIEEDRYLTTAIAEEAVDYLEEARKKDTPFFLYLPFSAPHTPFQATRKHYDRFSHIEDESRRTYYAMIAALDDAVGMIAHALKEMGLEENTLLIFTSDNGGATYTEATENYPLEGGKMTHFEGGLNVPLMMRRPGTIPAGTRFSPRVSLLDILPTVAASAGTPLPPDRPYDGVDLMPYVAGGRGGGEAGEAPELPHQVLFFRSDYTGVVIKDGWKLIRDEKRDRSHLFNLGRDKTERRDLSAEEPEKAKELLDLFRRWSREMSPPRWRSFIEFRFKAADGTYHYFPI